MAFSCNDLWHNIPIVKNLQGQNYPHDLFRISLADFLHVWQGFESKNLDQKRERLEKIFNTDYFDDYIVVTDKVSIENLKMTTFYQPSPRDGSGLIYIYTYEDSVQAGLYKQFWLLGSNRYEAKIKIGRTEQHPFYRIEQQLYPKVNIPEPPILLTALWTNLVAPCERKIHQALIEQGKRLVDRKGRDAKGGVEWFKDTPTRCLPMIYKWVKYYRELPNIEIEDLKKEDNEFREINNRVSRKSKQSTDEDLELDLLDKDLGKNSAEINIPMQLILPLERPAKPKPCQQSLAKLVTASKPKTEKASTQQPQKEWVEIKRDQTILLTGNVSVQELAAKIAVHVTEIIKILFDRGIPVTINQTLDVKTATVVAAELGVVTEIILEEPAAQKITGVMAEAHENLHRRPPVVTIMGHVDHGKTTLLDSIRKSKVAQGEAGGITQHIGAYHVNVEHNGKIEQVVFLDTPGHQAFTAMRVRGARVTDVVVLVVAADDGVRPQTIEAISHAKAAEVPIVIAINKVDKPDANPDRVKQELTKYGLVAEEWGGDTIMVPVSALTGDNLDTLLEMLLLVSEVEDLYANPDHVAKGTVIEANLDKSRGPVATLLIQNGTLHVGDILVAGSAFGKVRAMIDDRSKRVEIAGPSFAVKVLGLSDVPAAGDEFLVFKDEKEARALASDRAEQKRQSRLQQAMTSRWVTLSSLSNKVQEGDLKELNLLLKGDVQGSVEAILAALQQLPQKEVQVRVLLAAPGEITETDVDLAAASNAVIIGFNTTFASGARQAADDAGVDARNYTIIYHLLDDVQAAMERLLEPELVEETLGQIEVRSVFPVGRGAVAGCYVQSGKTIRNCKLRVRRGSNVIFDGNLDSLKRMKEDAKEVNAGYECGIGVDDFNSWELGDIIEAYRIVSKRRKLLT